MSSYDKIAASRPVNKEAALATSRGEDYVSAKRIVVEEWDTPPRLTTLNHRERSNPSIADLVGRTFGRLRVIGPIRNESDKLMWLCRCTCGKYCSRKQKAILNPANDKDRCQQCLHLAYLQRHDSAEQRIARKAQGLGY